MKKAFVSGITIALVVVGIGMSYMLFRGGMRTGKEQKSLDENKENMENLMEPGQDGEVDDVSEAFSKSLKEKAGLTVDPKNIVSVGSPITSGIYSFTVNSWRVSKESPGYALPEGLDLNGYWPQVDHNGNITNPFSYVIVDITVENMADEPANPDICLWSDLRLKAFDMSFTCEGKQPDDEFISDVRYLGEETPRAYGHDYSKESFAAGETKSYPLIFFMPDEILNNQEIYLEIDTSGANPQPSDPEFAVKHFILLN